MDSSSGSARAFPGETSGRRECLVLLRNLGAHVANSSKGANFAVILCKVGFSYTLPHTMSFIVCTLRKTTGLILTFTKLRVSVIHIPLVK